MRVQQTARLVSFENLVYLITFSSVLYDVFDYSKDTLETSEDISNLSFDIKFCNKKKGAIVSDVRLHLLLLLPNFKK